ncbi:hypothetical protein NA57DRAFT_75453 [Rhizodiscina lignyota]|uniref:Xylanolytic transcriptional activator regulatory domain-containing protein n=1 Tax=Rhizodiscina lignyota TaxID=1504668 RepID=A0A9P4IHX1_9PEZI|nr:hypothetical protein NA57DRAFT_75453 [Rhizodiscina lignyota]
MRLVLDPPPMGEDPKTSSYLAAKYLLVDLEAAGIPTVETLQALMLITLYEIGHAIYPAAYMSVSLCARMAIALGMDKVTLASCTEMHVLEFEKRKRMWWTALLLDRYVSIGCPGRQLATKGPKLDDPLPDDDNWDASVRTPAVHNPMTLASDLEIKVCPFARLAQATNLLELVLSHVASGGADPKYSEEEVLQLSKTLIALAKLAESEMNNSTSPANCSTQSLCRSALYVLHQHYLSESEKDAAMSPTYCEHAERCLVECSEDTLSHLRSLLKNDTNGPNMVPLLSLPSLYQAAVVQTRLFRKSEDEDIQKSVGFLKATLKAKRQQWRVAETYLRMLEAREVMEFL